MLTVNNLCKRFTLHMLGGKEINACQGVSFHVAEGMFLGLSGPSGAGKSTVLRCIYRTYLASAGSIRYNSLHLGSMDLAQATEQDVLAIRHREMGYVAQFFKVIPRVSAIDVITAPLVARNGLTFAEARERAVSLLERLRIPRHLFDAYPATFSGGEQQRVNIARAVGWRPRLLLLDEPTASLDPGSVDLVLELLAELRDQGTTMVGIFHDAGLMRSVTDEVYHVG